VLNGDFFLIFLIFQRKQVFHKRNGELIQQSHGRLQMTKIRAEKSSREVGSLFEMPIFA
jgi:hypothetical protein